MANQWSNDAGVGLNNLLDLRVFVAVIQAGSFTCAAEQTNLSRSAVGKCIARLENSLQSRLIHRTTRVLRLSVEGELFYESAQRILQDIAEVEHTLLKRDKQPKGVLRLTVPVVFGRLHVMPVLLDYLAKYTEIDAEVIFTDDYLDLVKEGIDVAIRVGHGQDSSLVQKVLAQHQFITCASAPYLAQHGTPEQLSDLPMHQGLAYLRRGQAVPWRFTDQDQALTIMPTGRLRLHDTEALKNAAIAGMGIVQLSQFLIADALKNEQLLPILSEFNPPTQPICAVYSSKKQLSAKIRLWIDCLETAWAGKTQW